MGATWGRIVKIKGRGGKPDTWGVRGVWKGERIQFSSYQTVIGRQPCRTEAEARQLQAIVGHEVAHGIFDPARYRKEKPLQGSFRPLLVTRSHTAYSTRPDTAKKSRCMSKSLLMGGLSRFARP